MDRQISTEPASPPSVVEPGMPRATSERFGRAHQSSVKKNGVAGNTDASAATRNPIFNTERFGQHILKNPLVAQG